MNARLWLGALAALTLFRLIAAALVPLAPDEAYYWLWSQHLQAGYYDDAPMVAFWIRGGTALAGPSPFGIRLLSPLAAALGSVLIWRAGEDLFPRRDAGILAAILLNATLVLGAGAVITTPDTPLILFWTAGIAALARWIRSGDDRWWLAAGAAAGLALDSKYTGLLLIAAAGLWLLSFPAGRKALARPLPWAGMILGFLLFLPVILWNARHGWASFLKQGGRVTHFNAVHSLSFLGSFIGGQIGLATPIIALLMALGTWRAARASTPEARLLAFMVLLPGAVFLEHTLSGSVQPNWPAILYPGAALAAAGMAGRTMRRWMIPAACLGFIITLLVYAQAIAAPLPLPARRDPTALQLAGWHGLARAVAREAERRHARFVTAPDYATIAELSHDLPQDITVIGYSGRWHYLSLASSSSLAGATGLLIQPDRRGPPILKGARLVGAAARRRGGQTISGYRIYEIPAPPYRGIVRAGR
ncbi:MAG TPA: glycosyltransferase family 39 protein [Acetobacteraceae bacterium]|nr:glycosyltransferase family 39 protein [Acetobacteraceae bacterium]